MTTMRVVLLFAIIILILGIGYFALFQIQRSEKETILKPEAKGNMIITSPVFQNNAFIPSKYTCDGENVNPPLEIKNVPPAAKSLVLIVDDSDAPMDVWTHWAVWNIEPKTTLIPEQSVPPQAVEGKTSFGKPGYGGPCPPSGTHRYFFKLYALDAIIEISSQADKSALEKAMEGRILDKTQIIGLYSRR